MGMSFLSTKRNHADEKSITSWWWFMTIDRSSMCMLVCIEALSRVNGTTIDWVVEEEEDDKSFASQLGINICSIRVSLYVLGIVMIIFNYLINLITTKYVQIDIHIHERRWCNQKMLRKWTLSRSLSFSSYISCVVEQTTAFVYFSRYKYMY